MAQSGEERQRLPVTMRNFGDEAFATQDAAVGAGHVRFGPGLIDEDEARGIERPLMPPPPEPPARNVRSILLAGVQAFF